MNTKQKIINQIAQQIALPLFYHDQAHTSVATARTLYKAGLRVIEYTKRGQSALENFKALKQLQLNELPDLVLGIGTIRTISEALNFIQAGADFIIAPVVDAGVAQVAAEHQMLWIPGCMTPTEIHMAGKLGAPMVKIFPANVLGPNYISAIRELFPDQRFIATGWGDMTEENIRNWMQSGVLALGLGSKLITKSKMDYGDFDGLYTETVKIISLIKKNSLKP